MIAALEWGRILALPIAGVVALVVGAAVLGSETFDRAIAPMLDDEAEEGQEEANPDPFMELMTQPVDGEGVDTFEFAWTDPSVEWVESPRPWSDPSSRPLDDVEFALWEAEFGPERYDLDE